MSKQKIAKLIENKDYKAAKELILKCGEKLETDVELQKNLGLCNINLGCLDEAMENFTKVEQNSSDDALSKYYLSIIYIEKNRLDEAQELLNKVIELRPMYIDAYKSLCICYLKQKKYNEVIELKEKMMSINPDDVQVLDILATAYNEIGNFSEVINMFEQAVKLSPDDYKYYNKLGVAYYTNNETQKALVYYEKALSLNNQIPAILFNTGMAYFTLEKYEEAASYIKKALDIEYKPSYLNSYAMAALKGHMYKEAVEAFSQLVKEFPDKENYSYNLACAYDGAGELEKASDIIDKLLALNLNSVQLKLHLASLYARRSMFKAAKLVYGDLINSGFYNTDILYEYAVLCAKSNDTDKAEEIFKKIIAEKPDFAYAYKDLGIIYLSRRFFDRALENFKKAIKLQPHNVFIIFEFGNYYYLMSEFENAKKMYNKLLRKDKIPVYMMVSIALNYMAMNSIDEAKEILIKAMEIEPQNVQVLFRLGQVYVHEKNYKNAKQLLEDAYAINPNPEIANVLAQVYMEIDQCNEAFVLLNLVKLSNPANISVLINLAKCKIKQNDLPQAKEYINSVLEILPEHEEALELKKTVEEKENK